MSGFAPLRPLLLVLLACASTPLAAETRIEAPGGVAAQNITNSPISIGLSPDEQIHLVEVFLQRNAVTDEARAKAEARASELGAQLGFTREAVIGFFRILGEQDVSPEQIPLKLGEIAARHRAMLDRWSVLDTADPATAALAAEAKAAIDSGRYDQADALLVQTEEQDAAAARQAEQLARDAQQAAERRWLRGKARRSRNDTTSLCRCGPALRGSGEHSANIASRRAARLSGPGSRGTLSAGRRARRQYRRAASAHHHDTDTTTTIAGRRAAPMGRGRAQPWPRAHNAGRSGERDGASGGGGSGPSCGARGANARTGAARLGRDGKQPRRCTLVIGGPWERDGTPTGGGGSFSCRAGRYGRAIGCRSTGQIRRTASATRSGHWASEKAAQRIWRRRSQPTARLCRRSRGNACR